MERDQPLDLLLTDEIQIDNSNNKRTAKTATLLIQREIAHCYEPSASERTLICVEFARQGKPVYGKAFDLFRIEETYPRTPSGIEMAIDKGDLRIIEVKSTGRAGIKDDFTGYFFSLSTAELLVAQSLGDLYQFAFFNTSTKKLQLMNLNEVYKRARGVYPTWSIRF